MRRIPVMTAENLAEVFEGSRELSADLVLSVEQIIESTDSLPEQFHRLILLWGMLEGDEGEDVQLLGQAGIAAIFMLMATRAYRLQAKGILPNTPSPLSDEAPGLFTDGD